MVTADGGLAHGNFDDKPVTQTVKKAATAKKNVFFSDSEEDSEEEVKKPPPKKPVVQAQVAQAPAPEVKP